MQRLSLKLIRAPGRTVYRIPQDRMADGRHVDTDLMRPPGLQFALNIRIIPEPLQNTVMGHSAAGIGRFRAHFLAIRGMTSDGRIYRAMIILQVPVDDRMITPGDRMFLQLFC